MSRQSHLATELADARRRTDELFSLLVPDALYDRPIPERHRNIFYLGHLEAFDWNQVCRRRLEMPSFHPEFDKLFELGIDPPVGRLPEDGAHRSFLDDAPGVHDGDPVRRSGDDGEVVGDEEQREVERGFHFAQQVENLCLDRHIERSRGFVGDDERGAARQRHRDEHALSHSTRARC